MAKGSKISKKALKEPDEFITLTDIGLRFVRDHGKQVVLGAAAVVVIALAVVFYGMWQEKKENEASRAFAAAMEAYQKVSSPFREVPDAELKQAVTALAEVAATYPKSQPGRITLLYKGSIHLRLGEFDDAVKAYEAFLEKGGKEKFLRLLAFEGLAYAFEGKKDYQKALDQYQKMVDLGETSLSGNAYLGLGRCYEKLGKTKEALESYKAYLKTADKSQETNTVLRKVSLLEAVK